MRGRRGLPLHGAATDIFRFRLGTRRLPHGQKDKDGKAGGACPALPPDAGRARGLVPGRGLQRAHCPHQAHSASLQPHRAPGQGAFGVLCHDGTYETSERNRIHPYPLHPLRRLDAGAAFGHLPERPHRRDDDQLRGQQWESFRRHGLLCK